MFEKAIDPIWVKYDPEVSGFISKDKCSEMAQQTLEQVSMSQYYNQMAFDKVFEQIDTENTQKIKKNQCVELVNFMVMGGF